MNLFEAELEISHNKPFPYAHVLNISSVAVHRVHENLALSVKKRAIKDTATLYNFWL